MGKVIEFFTLRIYLFIDFLPATNDTSYMGLGQRVIELDAWREIRCVEV